VLVRTAPKKKAFRAAKPTSRPSGKWNEDDYDVLAGDIVVGRIMKAIAAPVGSPWFWTLAFGYHRGQPTARAAMAAFAKSWRRE